MARTYAPTPAPGRPIRRTGKAYIWVTWLAKLLGGNQCLWSVWFKAHFRYAKVQEEEAFDLAEWSRDHNRMMRDRRLELQECGWTVTAEEQNAFQLEGHAAVVAGKPDLIATMPGHALVVDGKTGRERESDWWQVLFYLFAFPKCRPEILGKLVGEIHYLKGGKHVDVLPRELSPARLDDVVSLIKILGSDTPPAKAPSRDECKRCNIGAKDCPERMGAGAAHRPTMVGEF